MSLSFPPLAVLLTTFSCFIYSLFDLLDGQSESVETRIVFFSFFSAAR